MNDGSMEVSFSELALEVYATFTPPILNGYPLSTKGVTRILESINVVNGIRWDFISQALDECNIHNRQVRDVLIAQGEAPEEEILAYYERNPRLGKKKYIYDRKARINYREHSPFIIVKKGQTLATLIPHRPGKIGVDVRGNVLPFETIIPVGVSGGANTRIENDKIVADTHGQLIDEKNVLSVQDYLVIKGAVGYRTGHIAFPGDVIVHGPVADGFKIYAGGSLTVKETLDLTEIVTKGDIIVNGGIIGKGSALIKSGGGIKAKFVENCRVAARKSILIEAEIISSSMYTLNTVQMNDKGAILGGEIYSVHGVRAGTIGKKSGKPTRIYCGIDFTVLQEQEKCHIKLRNLAAKLARMRELMENPVSDTAVKGKLENMYKMLEKEQQALFTRVSELMGKVIANENARVEVLGEIAAGTVIEICQVALVIEDPIRRSRIRLDAAAGKLVVDPL